MRIDGRKLHYHLHTQWPVSKWYPLRQQVSCFRDQLYKGVYTVKRIAVEEHYGPESLERYLLSQQNQVTTRRKWGRSFIDKRLKDMDEASIDMQVLSVGMPGLHNLSPVEGTAMSREIDDEIAEVVGQHSVRLAGLAAIAPQDPATAADELERAVKKLGLKGALINSNVKGEYLDEQKYWVILERAASLGVPIYLHPDKPSPDMIKPYLKYPPLQRAFWGYGAETGLHAMRLICSGVFDRYPTLRIVLGHLGETLPFWMWRMDNHWDMDWPAEAGGQPQKKPSEYIKENFYVTTSGMFWPTVIQFVCLALGAERILFAVDYPIESNEKAVESIENTPISDNDKEKILHLNAERVFGL